MATSQTKTIQLLRSSTVYASASAAKTAVGAMNGQDGEIRIARYNAAAEGETANIQSMLCVYHATPDLPSGSGNGWTFIEDVSNNADSPAALKELIEDVIAGAGLNNDGSYTAKTGDEIVGDADSINDAVEAIINHLKGLDKSADVVSGQVVTTVEQANGLVSETKANLTDIVMAGYAADTTKTGAIAATDTLEQAFNKLENAVASTTVTNTDGSIVVTPPTGNATTTDVNVNVDGTTIVKSTGGALKADLTMTALTAAEVTALSDSNVKEAYKLIYSTDASRNAIGNVIKIYKDSSLLSVALLHAQGSTKPTYSNGTWTDVDSQYQIEANLALCFAYQLADGTTSVEAVPVGNFLRESEFGDGLQVTNGIVTVKTGDGLEFGSEATGNKSVKVKIDSTSESFLTVGANGVKLAGVQNAINTAKATIDAYTVNGKTINTSPVLDGTDINVDGTATTPETVAAAIARLDAAAAGAKTIVAEGTDAGNNMTITKTTDTTTQADTYTISLSGIAQDSEVVKSVNTKTPTNGAVTVGGGDIALTNYSKGSSADPVAATDTVNAAIGKLENQIDAIDTAIDALDADLDATGTAQHNGTFVVSGVTQVDGELTSVDSVEVEAAGAAAAAKTTIDAYTVNAKAISTSPVLNGADIKLDGYTVASTNAAVSATDTVNQAIGKVEKQIADVKTTADGALQSISSGNNAIAVGTEDANHDQTVSLVVATVAQGNNEMLSIGQNGLTLSTTWDCGTF